VLAVWCVAVPAVVACVLWLVPRRLVATTAYAGGVATSTLAVLVAVAALRDAAHPEVGDWIALDAAAGVLIGVIGLVGLVTVITSPSFLDTTETVLVSQRRRARTYYGAVFAFWTALLAVPLTANLGGAWLLVEATTAASALLVGFSGKSQALEAGWKYLILTSLGLAVALLGIALLTAGIPSGGLGALSWRNLPSYAAGTHSATVAYVLVLAGLASKIGWAPVHNWLPDAHSQAPAPVSAMLSAALLPAVLLVAWRCEQGLAPVVGATVAQEVFLGFGLVSMAVAVPFLSSLLTWKRLLAYSSLEHMGVLALGIGFATPLALIGVAVHVVAHAIAKTLGFVATTPLLIHDPRAASHAVTGVARTHKALAVTIAVSLGTLAGLPPLPLFISELLIIAGGFQAGLPWVAAAAAALLALAFLGLMHALIRAMAGDPPERTLGRPIGLGMVNALAVISTVLLLALTGVAVWLSRTDLAQAFRNGVH
jgi:hydrogenase-4 component F